MNITNRYWYLKNLIAGLDKDSILAYDDSHHTLCDWGEKTLSEVIDFFRIRSEDLIKDRYYILFCINEAAKSEFFNFIDIVKAKVDLDAYSVINLPDKYSRIPALLIFPSFHIDEDLNIISNKLF
jgi:hypothetical protein